MNSQVFEVTSYGVISNYYVMYAYTTGLWYFSFISFHLSFSNSLQKLMHKLNNSLLNRNIQMYSNFHLPYTTTTLLSNLILHFFIKFRWNIPAYWAKLNFHKNLWETLKFSNWRIVLFNYIFYIRVRLIYLCRVKRLLVSHVQQTLRSFICSRPEQIHLIISCSTTVAVMAIMELACLLFSASWITGNVRWPREHENEWCFDRAEKKNLLCRNLAVLQRVLDLNSYWYW